MANLGEDIRSPVTNKGKPCYRIGNDVTDDKELTVGAGVWARGTETCPEAQRHFGEVVWKDRWGVFSVPRPPVWQALCRVPWSSGVRDP